MSHTYKSIISDELFILAEPSVCCSPRAGGGDSAAGPAARTAALATATTRYNKI